MPDKFIGVRALVTTLIQLKQQFPEKKVAFVFSGGGARAAWFAGVLEAIEQQVRAQQPNLPADKRFAPDIIVGTSGGALAGIAYFADLMNPGATGAYGPYVNRQSWLWRDVSHGNATGYRLLDNAGFLEFFSKSKVGITDMIQPDILLGKELDNLAAIFPHFKKLESPAYNFQMLFLSKDLLEQAKEERHQEWNETKEAFHRFGYFKEELEGYLDKLSHDWEADLVRMRNDITELKNDCDSLENAVSGANPTKILKAAKELLKDSGRLIGNTFDTIGDLIANLAKLSFGAIRTFLNKVRTVIVETAEWLVAVEQTFQARLLRLGMIIEHLDDLIIFARITLKMMKMRSSVMNTTGLKNAINEVLRWATPVTSPPGIAGPAMDQAIIANWSTRREAKAQFLAQPQPEHIRAPELFLTGTNITAGRLALFGLCDDQTAVKLAASHTWLINFRDRPALAWGKSAGGPNPRDPKRWCFTGVSAESTTPEKDDSIVRRVGPPIVNLGNSKLDAKDPLGSGPGIAGPAKKLGAAKGGQATPPIAMVGGFAPFDHEWGKSDVTGESLLAAAALTSSAIPGAFPPKAWVFRSPNDPAVSYKHWFVDGGICDNRPVQQALTAGADYIVSFETRAMRTAVEWFPQNPGRPPMGKVCSESFLELPLNSPFYRFFETFVGEVSAAGGPFDKQIWRISPNAMDGDYSVDAYDFNGSWQDRKLKMGLFDWFMRGYLDAHGSDAAQVFASGTDKVCEAYKSMSCAEGQLGNAMSFVAGQGFFEVDFVNNRPHPGYPG